MNPLHHPFLPALGTAVLHFLWQGALLGLLAALLLRTSRDRSPEYRYGLACLMFLAMPGAFLGTLLGQLSHALPAVQAASAAGAPLEAHLLQGLPEGPIRSSVGFGLPWVAGAWALGAATMLLRTASGLLWLHLGLARRAGAVSEPWTGRLHALRQAMGLARTVGLKVLDHLDSPVVIGAFRPVILVPAAVLSGLPPCQVEAILAHELSHIQRHDYLVNLFQVVTEALLFFHPAVWWLSREIRREREHCCDDAAVRRCGDAFQYASALAAMEAFRSSPITFHSHLAPAARGGSLMHRIQRILVPRPTPSTSGLVPVLGVLALLLAAGAAGSQLQAHPAAPPAPAPILAPVATHPSPAPARTMATNDRPVAEERKEEAPLPAPEPPPMPKMPSATVEVVATAKVPALPVEDAQPAPAVVDSFFQGVPVAPVKITSKPSTLPYPPEAREQGLHGTVTLGIIVSDSGKPRTVQLLAGPEALKASAEAYARGWVFTAPTLEGASSEARFLLTIRYKLM